MNSAVTAQLLEIIMAPESFAVNRKLNMQTGCQGFFYFYFLLGTRNYVGCMCLAGMLDTGETKEGT